MQLWKFFRPLGWYKYCVLAFIWFFSSLDCFSENWILSSVLKGIRWVYSTASIPRLPMIIDILIAMHSKLNLSSSKQASFRAICFTIFFVWFRKSHLLSKSHRTFDPNQQFIRSDFFVHVVFCWSKTTQLRERTFTVPRIRFPLKPFCAVSAILHAFSLTPSAVPTS